MKASLLPPPQAVSKTTSAKTLAKAIATEITTSPATSINHAADTIITLPLSKKTIVIQKGLPASIIAKLDKYFKTNKNMPTKNITVSPNELTCGLHIATYWETEEQYEPTTGKTLGIWVDWLSPSEAYTLGFRKILITGTSDRDASYNAGFQYQDMWLHIQNPTHAQSEMNAVNSSTIHINNCYIDEPYENSKVPWSENDVFNFASFLTSNYPQASLILSSYYRLINDYDMEYTIEDLNNYLPTYILCDKYNNDFLGQTLEGYWDNYKSEYGSYNIANWMSLEKNQSNSGNPDFSTLFGYANNLGLNEIWLYAYDYGNLSLLEQFPNAAWSNGWLLQLEKQVTTVWKCTDTPCSTGCVWPTTGNWYVYESYYTGEEQWVAY